MATVADMNCIPVEFWAALKVEPTCLTLRSAIADRLMELGFTDAADCLKWTVEKRRSPVNPELRTANNGDWQWVSEIAESHWKPARIPYELLSKKPLLGGESSNQIVAFHRLIGKWLNSTPEERQWHWLWEPPADKPL